MTDCPDMDAGGYALPPSPPKQPGTQQLANTTQELIPILPEDHPDYQKNREIVTEVMRRWKSGS
jgi:hypothetical protein